MATRRTPANPSTRSTRRGRPATTPEAREKQLIGLAMDEAERQLRNGTASSQLITHFVRAGSRREYIEQELITVKVDTERARAEQLASQKRVEELYADALTSMRSYQGLEAIEPQYDEYED